VAAGCARRRGDAFRDTGNRGPYRHCARNIFRENHGHRAWRKSVEPDRDGGLYDYFRDARETCGDNQSVAFSLISGADSSSVRLGVSNQGGGSVGFAASATTATGGDWLQVSPANGNVTASASTSLNITATPGKLDPGTRPRN